MAACSSSGAPSGWSSGRYPVLRCGTWTAAGSGTTSRRFENRKRLHPRRPRTGAGKTEDWAKNEDERYWKALVEDREREWHEARESEWTRLLVNTEFLDENDPQPATVAGLLLVGADPNRFLPQAGIDAVAYFGPEKDYDAKERRKLRGPIVRLQGADGTLLESGLPEQAVEFVRHNVETVILEDGIRRRERWDYPVEVVREAIVNAIVHRDYLLSGSDIELGIYSDRLEIVSPGRLTNGITPERMRFGCRSARNELLKDVMRDYGYMEHMGMGGAPDDHPGDARAQRHRAGSRRRWRALHRPAVERTARMKRFLARRPVLRTRALSGTQPAFVDAARA